MKTKFSENKPLLFWWVFMWAQFSGLLLAEFTGTLSLSIREDASHLSTLILILHIITSLLIGQHIARKEGKWLEEYRMIAGSMFYLGLIGTITGFLYMLHGIFSGGMPNSTVEIQRMLVSTINGLYTLLWATGFGITSSMLLNPQIRALERATE